LNVQRENKAAPERNPTGRKEEPFVKVTGLFRDDVVTRVVRATRLAMFVVGVFAVACSQQPFTLDASEPFTYSAVVDPPFERVAVVVTISDRSGDDLPVNPADFVARDHNNRIYPANPAAAVTDAHAVRIAHGVQNIAPLPVVTLRQSDVLSGFVVFDVPAGVRPVDLIWRQSDTDTVVHLLLAR
jgi:hypothetical protein